MISVDRSYLETGLMRMYGASAGKNFYDTAKPDVNGITGDISHLGNVGKVMTNGVTLLNQFAIFKKRLEDNSQRFVPSHVDFNTGRDIARADFFRAIDAILANLKPIEEGPLARQEAELKIIHAPASEDSPSVTLQWLKFIEFLEKKGAAEGGQIRIQNIWRAAISGGSELAYIAARKMEDTMFQDLCGRSTEGKGDGDFRKILIALWDKNKNDPKLASDYSQLRDAIAATKKGAEELRLEALQRTGMGLSKDDETRALLQEMQNKKVA